MVWGLLGWELKEHTKPCKPIQKRIFGDKIGDFELCLMGYMGAEVIACLTERNNCYESVICYAVKYMVPMAPNTGIS